MRNLLGKAYSRFGWIGHYLPIPMRVAEWWQDCYFEYRDIDLKAGERG